MASTQPTVCTIHHNGLAITFNLADLTEEKLSMAFQVPKPIALLRNITNAMAFAPFTTINPDEHLTVKCPSSSSSLSSSAATAPVPIRPQKRKSVDTRYVTVKKHNGVLETFTYSSQEIKTVGELADNISSKQDANFVITDKNHITLMADTLIHDIPKQKTMCAILATDARNGRTKSEQEQKIEDVLSLVENIERDLVDFNRDVERKFSEVSRFVNNKSEALSDRLDRGIQRISVMNNHDEITENLGLILQRDSMLRAIKQSLECVVCKSAVILGDIWTLCCCGQHICHPCKGRVTACPMCRTTNINAVKDVSINAIRSAMANHATDLPDLN